MNSQENQKSKEKEPSSVKISKSHIYACFQQPQTIDILKFLSMPTPYKLLFDSAMKSIFRNNGSLGTHKQSANEQSTPIVRRVKQYRFQRIYCKEEKFKYSFSQEINQIIQKLFQGYNQAVFVYGTEESKKDKILIGESQNSGFLLNTLAQIFQYCHEKQIQDEVTIKLSCSIFKQGKFFDPFKISQSQKQKTDGASNAENKRMQNDINNKNDPNDEQQSMVCEDVLQGKYFLGAPEIIIRNMRTALKIINLLTKKISQRRESNQQENTQNIIFTIKLEIDTAFDHEFTGEVYEYSIPKLYIVKLGNPSINNTLNGINKKNQWFINMFNFLQSEVLDHKGSLNKKVYENINTTIVNANSFQASEKQLAEILSANGVNTSEYGLILPFDDGNDPFTDYIKSVVMQGVADIHCFTSLTNKMTSNQCLTAFIFNNYLSSYQTKPKKTLLNIYKMKNQKNNYEEQLMNVFTLRETEINREKKLTEKYRSEYNIRLGDWGSKNINALINSSNMQTGKDDKQKSKFKDQAMGKRLQKDSMNNQSQKRVAQHQNPSRALSTTTNKKFDANLVKQSLKAIFALSCDEDGEIESTEWQAKMFLLKYIEAIKQFMNCCNIVEYQYAQVLSEGCQKLNKYIFNEEIEEFFYAKKISLEHSQDLKIALRMLKTQKTKLIQMQDRILKKITSSIKSVTNELEILREINGRQEHEQFFKVKKNKLTSLVKQRELVSKIFQYYNTMSFHYIYEDNQRLVELLQKAKRQIEEQFQKRNNFDHSVNYEEIMKNIKKGFHLRIHEKKSLKSQNSRQVDDQDQKNSQEKVNQYQDQINNEKFQQKNAEYLPKSKQIRQKSQTTQSFFSKTNQDSSLRTDSSQQQNNQRNSDNIKQLTEKALKYKMRKKEDQLHNMFTNSNVGVVRPQFHKRSK